jgi:hypothetical protein
MIFVMKKADQVKAKEKNLRFKPVKRLLPKAEKNFT